MIKHQRIKNDKNRRRLCLIYQKVFEKCPYREDYILAKHEKKTPNKRKQCHQSYGAMAILKIHENLVHEYVTCRGGGTGGAGGAIAPPTFRSLISIHSHSTTNIFGWLNIIC